MPGDPTPPLEPRSTSDVLSLLRTTLSIDGPFHKNLLTSFDQAQSRLLLTRMKGGESLPIEYQQIFAYDPESLENTQLMSQLFEQKINYARSERPVILLNVKEFAEEKIKSGDVGGVSYEDLQYSLSHYLIGCRAASNNEDGLYPVITPHYIPDDEKNHVKRVSIPNDDTNAEFAFIYGETTTSGPEFKALDSFLLGLSDGNFQLKTSILIPKAIVERDYGYGSPWVPKLAGTQLRDLDSGEISRTVAWTRRALNPEDENRIRVVIRPFGTGKTKMLKGLEEKLIKEGVPETTFIDGAQPMDEQKKAFEGSVILVDEAANLNVSQIRGQTKDDSIIVLFYPSRAAVIQKMQESGISEGSYTVIE